LNPDGLVTDRGPLGLEFGDGTGRVVGDEPGRLVLTGPGGATSR
jgi:hypothetical protein